MVPTNGKHREGLTICPIHGRILGNKCIACAALEYNRQVAAGERSALVHHANGVEKEEDPSPLIIRFRAIRERRISRIRFKKFWTDDERGQERVVRVFPHPGGSK